MQVIDGIPYFDKPSKRRPLRSARQLLKKARSEKGMSKHTRGPWVLSHETNSIRAMDGHNTIICHLPAPLTNPSMAADAALIAAAPDMLTMLKRATLPYSDVGAKSRPEWYEDAVEEIAKAEGR